MDKETFKKLPIEESIKYMNGLLNDNKSITTICKDIGMATSTLYDHFKRFNYKYDTITRQYIKTLIQKDNKAIMPTVIPKHNKSIIPKVIQNNNTSKSEIAITKDNKLLDEVNELIGMKDELKLLILEYNRSKSIIDVIEPAELKVDKELFKGELKGRLIKVYDNVNKDWIKFCKVNNQFKMQDLYSLALLEFINRYK